MTEYINGVKSGAGGDSGEGHITILTHSADSVTAGTWAVSAGSYGLATCFGNNGSQNDALIYKVYLAKGTYKVKAIGKTSNSSGIVTLSLDGGTTPLTTIDMYSNPDVNNAIVNGAASFTISSSGIVDLTTIIKAKHASSSGYYQRIGAYILYRTA
uniref:Uncharacterized protein n=2 Tax=viral metagenome TaxID=1070528 RepID=A0A6M3M0R0_9ZZZZ